MTRYDVAGPVFHTIQGEGALIGHPMIFIRMAGCSIGCPHCDTNYKWTAQKSIEELDQEVGAFIRPEHPRPWVWITGGEPTDQDLGPLIDVLAWRCQVAVATSGHRRIPQTWPIQWLSVSPHDPRAWVQRSGSEVKIIPGLNGFTLGDFEAGALASTFQHRFVSPLMPTTRAMAEECQRWILLHPGWRLTTQAHKAWKLP